MFSFLFYLPNLSKILFRIMSEYRTRKYVGGNERGQILVLSRNFPGGNKEYKEVQSRESVSRRDSNWVPPEYKLGALTLELACSVVFVSFR
jgi:hypothetical protein